MLCATMQQAPELWALGSALLGGSRQVCPGGASSQATGPHPQPLPAVFLKQTLKDTDPPRPDPLSPLAALYGLHLVCRVFPSVFMSSEGSRIIMG